MSQEFRWNREDAFSVSLSVTVAMRLCFYLLLVASFALSCVPSAALAQTTREVQSGKKVPDPRFEVLRERYQKLRNSDLEVAQGPQWRLLSESFEQYSAVNRARPEASDALLRAAILSEEVYRSHGSRTDADRALKLTSQIVREFAARPQVDDALLLSADLHHHLGQTAAALADLRTLETKFPSSELVPVALARRAEFTTAAELSTAEETRPKNKSALSSEASTGVSIVIDPGHGGDDTGAVGPAGIMEKDVTLAISLEVERLIKLRNPDSKVVLTRRSDRFVPLMERTELANALEADLFISIHANASPTGALSGVESYVLDNSNDKASKRLAERENDSLRFDATGALDPTHLDLSAMLSDLVQRGKQQESLQLAHELQRSVLRHIRTLHGDAQDLGVKRGPFFVLVGAKMPCALLEIGFIDNEVDGERLSDRSYRNLIAQGIYVGVRRFLDQRGKQDQREKQ